MQERGREYRIRQLQRKKREAAKQFKENEWKSSGKAIGIHANTPTRCSCDMCGNPRKHLGNSHHAKTHQELIANSTAIADSMRNASGDITISENECYLPSM